jgi:hypothetical protein
VLDLVEGGEVVTTLLTFLVGHQLLDLACPVDHDGFKTLDLVLFTGSCLNIVKLFSNRDVELSLASALVTGFSESAHELMQVGSKLLLDTIGPVIFTKQFGAVFSDHFTEKIVKRISIDHSCHNDSLHVAFGDLFSGKFKVETNLIVLGLNITA